MTHAQPLGQNRRRFVQAAAASALLTPFRTSAVETDANVFGPRPGYTPEIGTLVSEMAWMRSAVLRAARGLHQEQLDFLLDNNANRIGALLLHLAATETLYQLNTFDNVSLNHLGKHGPFKDWNVAMELGAPARQSITGHDLDYYLGRLQETRDKTLAEFRKRDDKWLMAVDQTWAWGPANNLCKWFHVTEHESHHAGQISLLRSRAPGAKSANAG